MVPAPSDEGAKVKIVESATTPYEQLVIYGGPKSRKTQLATALPPGKKWGDRFAYVVADSRVPAGSDDVDSYVATALRSVLDPERLIKLVPTGEPNLLEESHSIIGWARQQAKEGLKTLIWDPLTVTAEGLLQQYSDMNVGGSAASTLGKRETGTLHTHPGKHHYGAVHSSMMFLLNGLRSLPLNIILVFHEEVDDSGGLIEGMVGGPKTVGTAQVRLIPGIFDTIRMKVMQVAAGKSQVVAVTQREGIWLAGLRRPTPPPAQIIINDPVEFWKEHFQE